MRTKMPSWLYNETADIRRPTRTSDGQGGWTDTLHPAGTIRCRVRAWNSAEELVARQSGIRISHILYADHDANVRRGDVVTFRGVVADVRSIRRPSEPQHHLMADLEERQT
jgi:SPP1 family predicted phage head-tail adaptor